MNLRVRTALPLTLPLVGTVHRAVVRATVSLWLPEHVEP